MIKIKDLKNNKTLIVVIVSVVLWVTVLIYGAIRILNAPKYDEEWIIGKTSTEIWQKYGRFDLEPDSSYKNCEGNYCNCTCVYIIEDNVSRKEIDEAIKIYFDSEGLAYKTEIYHAYFNDD